MNAISELVQRSSSRHEFISNLIQELSPGEARRIFEAVSGRFLFCDILSSLPLEIVIKILKLIGPRAPFSYKRVCKKWAALLSSHDIHAAFLTYFYSRDFVPLLGEAAVTAVGKLALREKHSLAVGSRRPFMWALHPVLSESSTTELDGFGMFWGNDYYDGIFAWVVLTGDDYRESVRSFDLVKGTEFTFRTPDRSKINKVRVMLGRIVVLVTNSGRAYAVHVADRTTISIRLQNSWVACMGGRERYLSLGYEKQNHRRDIWIWDLEDDQVMHKQLDDWDSYPVLKAGASVSCDARQVSLLRSSPLHGHLYVTIYDLGTGQEVSTTTFRWPKIVYPSYDFASNCIVSDILIQDRLRGLGAAVHHFFDKRPEFRDPMSGDLRVFQQEIDATARDKEPQLVWGTDRLNLCIIPLHPQMVWPRGYGAYYLFCVASFDRDLELAGGDKSAIIQPVPGHQYW